MDDKPAASASPNPAPQRFATTHWSMVLQAARDSTQESRQALERLCQVYWYPLYAFVRRKGYSSEEAQDITQDFFAFVLEKRTLQVADRDRGRFRTFLLSSLQNFLHKRHRAGQTLKRGGGKKALSLDLTDGASRYDLASRISGSDSENPEQLFQRQWALTLMNRAIERLAQEQRQAGKGELYELLKSFLVGDHSGTTYTQIARQRQVTEGAIKVMVHRLRRRCGELLRDEIAQTVDSPADVDDELNQLFNAVG